MRFQWNADLSLMTEQQRSGRSLRKENSGFVTLRTTALNAGSNSFISNGEATTLRPLAEPWTAGHGTKCLVIQVRIRKLIIHTSVRSKPKLLTQKSFSLKTSKIKPAPLSYCYKCEI